MSADVILEIIKASSPLAVAGLGWWLSGRFRKVEEAGNERLTKITDAFRSAIQDHERVDQKRHEENLGRFANIRVMLARAGLNGHEREEGNAQD